MQVDLVAVDRAIWSGRATMVVARTVEGDIGVMPGHAPLLAELREGFAARIQREDGSILGIAVHGGFLSVTADGAEPELLPVSVAIVTASCAGTPLELALTDDALTALRSWVESRPPGPRTVSRERFGG
jgi:F-type H+-transporting ATPase subunit epsilon